MAIVKFVGPCADVIQQNHPDVVAAVCRMTSGAGEEHQLTIHVAPFPDDGEPMEWLAQIVSPRGRQTFEVTQRVPFGGVSVKPQTR